MDNLTSKLDIDYLTILTDACQTRLEHINNQLLGNKKSEVK